MKKVLVFCVALSLFGLCYVIFRGINPPTPPEPVPFANNSHVGLYIDKSLSMRGFFRANDKKGTVIQRFMWTWMQSELGAVLPDSRIYFATFGNRLDPPELLNKSLYATFRFSNKAKRDAFFADTSTLLVEQFKEKHLSDYLAFVLITDGLASSQRFAGPDPRLISTIRDHLIQPGFHLWLIAIRNEFDGVVYPEVPGPTGKKAFRYKGLRPIFIWIGSPRVDIGIEIAVRFKLQLNKLAQQQVHIQGKESVKLVELTYIQLPDIQMDLNNQEEKLLVKKESNTQFKLTFSKHINKEMRIPIDMKWNPAPIHHDLSLAFDVQPPRAQVIEEDNRWWIHLDPRRIKSLELVVKAEPQIETWWRQWSTQDDSSAIDASKCLYLEQLIDGLREPKHESVISRMSIKVD